MTAEVTWLRRAREQLEEIATSIALDNGIAADRLIARVATRAALLADFPRMGPRWTAIAPAVRILVERPYLLLYRTIPDSEDEDIWQVEIVSVVDGRRDPDRLL